MQAGLGFSIVVQKGLETLFGGDETSFVLTLDEWVLLENEHGAVGWFAEKLCFVDSAASGQEVALGRGQGEKVGQLVFEVNLRGERLVGECAVNENVDKLCRVDIVVVFVELEDALRVLVTLYLHFFVLTLLYLNFIY
jgi:hypothetical protein